MKNVLKFDDQNLKDIEKMDDLKFEELLLDKLGFASEKLWNEVLVSP